MKLKPGTGGWLGRPPRYELLHPIFEDGIGSLWEAEDTHLRRPVFARLLSASLLTDKGCGPRLRQTLGAAFPRLRHPNVAQVIGYSSGEDGGTPFVIVEQMRGETVAARLRREGPLPAREALRIAVCVARAVEAAHEIGVLHGTLSPLSIILTDTGEVKVIDFAIVGVGFPVSGNGRAGGPPRYVALKQLVSPYTALEQLAGEPTLPESDVYSLGAILYEMVIGRPPGPQTQEDESRQSPGGDEGNRSAGDADRGPRPQGDDAAPQPTPAAALADRLPPAVVQMLSEALQPLPESRPDARHVVAVLAAALETEPEPGPNEADSAPPAELAAPTAGLSATYEISSAWADHGAPTSIFRRPRSLVVLVSLALIVAVTAVIWTRADRAEPPTDTGESETVTTIVETATVPDVIGMRLTKAVQEVSDAGLAVGDVVLTDGEKDVVVRSDPTPGEAVLRDALVQLFVGDGG